MASKTKPQYGIIRFFDTKQTPCSCDGARCPALPKTQVTQVYWFRINEFLCYHQCLLCKIMWRAKPAHRLGGGYTDCDQNTVLILKNWPVQIDDWCPPETYTPIRRMVFDDDN